MTQPTDDIESRAETIYRQETVAWTGNEWDWAKASHEVREKFLQKARERQEPYLPDPAHNPRNRGR